jgi:hypothetical protein
VMGFVIGPVNSSGYVTIVTIRLIKTIKCTWNYFLVEY